MNTTNLLTESELAPLDISELESLLETLRANFKLVNRDLTARYAFRDLMEHETLKMEWARDNREDY